MLLVVALGGGCKESPARDPEPPARGPEPRPEKRGEGWSGYATQERCAPPGVHLDLEILTRELSLWMTDDEVARLDAIDLTGTRAGDKAIAWSLVDGAARTLVPLHLDALDLHGEARMLRKLRRLRDPSSGDVALQALSRIGEASDEESRPGPDLDVIVDLDNLIQRSATEPWRGPEDDEHCYELGEAHSVVSSLAEAAVEAGAPRKAVVAACLALVKRAARAARQRR